MIIDDFFPGFKGKVHLKTRLCGIGKYNGNTLNTLLLTIMRFMLTNGDSSESCMNNEHTFSIPNRQRMECRGQKFTEEELRWRLGKFSQHRSYPSSLSWCHLLTFFTNTQNAVHLPWTRPWHQTAETSQLGSNPGQCVWPIQWEGCGKCNSSGKSFLLSPSFDGFAISVVIIVSRYQPQVRPFSYRPMVEAHLWLQKNDEFILRYC